LNTIESRIREQKDKIKEAQRELSRLQDEARKKAEPLHVIIKDCAGISRVEQETVIRLVSNKYLPYGTIRAWVDSLNATPSEPKSYVDWNKISKEYNWVAIDDPNTGLSPKTGMYIKKPHIDGHFWTNTKDYISISADAIIAPFPSWNKSLIHRPGAKE
jgi:hypothetical protein